MDKALLIDIGSTNIKWAICNKNAEIEKLESVNFPDKLPFPEPYYEVDTNRIIDSLKSIVDEESDCNSVYISTQMHGYILADKKYLPVTNYISWRDGRSKNLKVPFSIYKNSGTELKTNLPRVSVYAISKYQKGLYKYAQHFFTLGSFFAYNLVKKNDTHITDACPSGFYTVGGDPVSNFDFKIPIAHRKIKAIGKYKKMKVYVPVGDQQASVLSVDDVEDSYILNLGTAAQICCIEDNYISGDYESRPYFYGKTLCTVTGLIGGHAISKSTNDDIVELIVEDYMQAIDRLPKRKHIVVIGGVLNHHKELVYSVMIRLGLPYRFDMDGNALIGLSKIYKEMSNHE